MSVSFQDSLQPLLGLRVAAEVGGFHDPRLSSSDGMGYTFHCARIGCAVSCTKYYRALFHAATGSCPLTHTGGVRREQSLQLYQENWHAAVKKVLIVSALCSAAVHHCTE